MSNRNRLEISIAARTEAFDQALNKLRAQAKAAGANVSQSLEQAGSGAESLSQSVTDAAGSFNRIGQQSAAAFDQVGQEAQEAGRDVRGSADAMARALADLQKEAAELRQDLNRIGDSSSEIDQLKQQLQQLEGQLKETGSAADEISFDRALDSAQNVLGKLQELTGSFSSVADETRAMERAIKQAFSDPKKAEQFIKVAKQLQDEYGELVQSDSIGKAVKRLDTLGAATEENLRLVAKAAAESGRDAEDVAEQLGEAFANLDSGVFDPGIFEELRVSLGIGAKELEKYGARLDENNKVLGEYRADQEAAQKALRAYLTESEKYADVAGRSRDAQAEAAEEVAKFQRNIGETITELKNFVAEALLPMLKYLNDSPEGFKRAAAGVIFLLTPLIALLKGLGSLAGLLKDVATKTGPFTAGFAKAQEAVGSLASRMTGAGGAIKNFATGTGGSVLALVGLAKASYDTAQASNEYGESLVQLDKAQTAFSQTLSAAIREEEGILEIRKLSTEQIAEQARQFEEYAARKIFLTLAIVEATDALKAAEDSGDEKAIKAAQERLQNVFSQRKEEQLAHKERTEQIAAETKAQEQGFQAASDAYKQFKTDFDRGVFQSKEQALAALQDIAGGLSGESQKNALAEARSLQQEILKEKLSALHQSVEAEKTSVQQAQTIQAGLLATYEANLDQRREAAERLLQAEEKINERRLKNEERLQEQKLELERSAVQQRIALAQDSPELASLERRLAAGEDVVAQIKREAQEQTNKLKGYVEEEAAIERIALAREKAAAISADPTNADTIAQQAAERLRQLNLQVAAEQAKLDQQLADKRAELDDKRAKLLEKQAKDKEAKQKAEADQQAKTAALRLQVLEEELAGQEEVFQQRRQHLEALAAAGEDVSEQQKQLAKEEVEAAEEAVKKKLDLKKAEIAARQALEDVAATREQKALNAKQAALAIDRATREARQELQTIIDSDTEKLKQQTTELEKQLQTLKEQNEERKKAAGFTIDSSFGGIGGLDKINEFGGGFGEARQPKEAKGPTEQELEQQIARNKIEQIKQAEKAKQNATKTTGDTTPTQRPINVPSGDRSQQPQVSANEARPVEPSQPLTAPANPEQTAVLREIKAILQQNLTAMQQTAANTKPQPPHVRNVAQDWERSAGFTLGPSHLI